MWIAKPLSALSPSERKAWRDVQTQTLARGEDFPLGQTLAWGDAIAALGVQADLVMSLTEGVGGIVHEVAPGEFECVNGPILFWDDRERVLQQFSTFAMGVSKLSRNFSSVTLQPRWPKETLGRRLGFLPMEPQSISEAATILIPIAKSEQERRAQVSPRLRRSLKVADREGIQSSWTQATAKSAGDFAVRMKKFGKERGFFVPGPGWFEKLVGPQGESEGVLFYFAQASYEGEGSAGAELLIGITGKTAHYLFGCEERSSQVRSAISPSVSAHFRALAECASLGVTVYDLNGYTEPGESEDPYASVSLFKAQFNGKTVTYSSPSFQIEA